MSNTYESKARTKTIKATSRGSIKVGDSFYTVEYCEERTVPNLKSVNLEEEKKLLWEDVNFECDNQIEDILKQFK